MVLYVIACMVVGVYTYLYIFVHTMFVFYFGYLIPLAYVICLTKGSKCRKNKKLRFLLIVVEQVMTKSVEKKN